LIDRMVVTLLKGDEAPDCETSCSFAPLPNPLQTSYASQQESPKPRASPAPSFSSRFEEACAPFAFALQISGQLAGFWCATDKFEVEILDETNSAAKPPKQIRFQGLWWGPERIWVGDFVRLKPRRPQLVSGQLAASSSVEAETRGLFLKLSTIYLDEATDADGRSYPVPMIAGELYEVAEGNFVDPQPTQAVLTPPRKPVSAFQALPDPPIGYRFRRITPSPDHEIHLSLTMLAGRYYPKLINSPLLESTFSSTTLRKFLESLGDAPPATDAGVGPLPPIRVLLGMEGLLSGANCAIEALTWKEGRSPMFAQAWNQAKDDLAEFWRESRKAVLREDGGAAGTNGTMVKQEDDEGMLPQIASGSTFHALNLQGGFSDDDAIYID